MHKLNFLWQIISNITLIRYFLDKFSINVSLFYYYFEALTNDLYSRHDVNSQDYKTILLGPEDIKKITTMPGRSDMEGYLLQRMNEGNLCFGIIHEGELIAFTWCALDKFPITEINIPLKKDEAYLFDAYTLDSYRGKGIAPYLRLEIYKKLDEMGKKKLYSVSDIFNTPAIRFKKKLNAKILKLILVIT